MRPQHLKSLQPLKHSAPLFQGELSAVWREVSPGAPSVWVFTSGAAFPLNADPQAIAREVAGVSRQREGMPGQERTNFLSHVKDQIILGTCVPYFGRYQTYLA